MRATAAIAISLILHCIPQKVTGMEAVASGEEAAVAVEERGGVFSVSGPFVQMRP